MTGLPVDTGWAAGRLSTEAEASESFYRTIYQPGVPHLAFERTGAFWEAAEVARDGRLTGSGKRIAVIDAGFDMEISSIAAVASPQSQTTPSTLAKYGRHGTVVALLVHEVAPEAELLLLDVAPVSRSAVGSALSKVARLGAAVVNLSLEFQSDCHKAPTPGYDLSVVLKEDPGAEAFLRNLDLWIAGADAFQPGGCRRKCEVCAAIRIVSGRSLVISAAGNAYPVACPACNDRCVGIGFEHQRVVRAAEGELLTRNLPYGFTQNLITEITVAQPAGFFGTSFASPLVAALAAVVEDPQNFVALAGLPFAMVPVSVLLGRLQQSGRGSQTQVEALHRGFVRLMDEVPEAHRHWDGKAAVVPCVSCSAFMVDWYRDFIAFLASAGNAATAVEFGAIGEIVMPKSAEVIGNYAVATRALAWSNDDSSERPQLLTRAADLFRKAATLRPESTVFLDQAAAIEAELAG